MNRKLASVARANCTKIFRPASQNNSSPHRRLARGLSLWHKSIATVALSFSFLLLGGCGGGGGVSVAGNNQSSDPATVEYPIAYVRRPVPEQPVPQNKQSDLQNPFAFNPGAHLLVRSRADSAAEEVNVTDALFPGETDLYDVKDLTVSPDGKQLVFALHAPMLENADPIDQPSWDIYVYNFATKQVRAVITSKSRTEGNDVAPQFLDDGRIVFVSDRQARTRELLSSTGSPAYSGVDESRNRRAGVLHIMDGDGTDIKQISFNQSHDLSPSLLRNGKLVFMRWDRMGSDHGMNLYTMNPSGMGLSLLYGYHSHDTGSDGNDVQFSQPREMEDGRIATIVRPNRSLGAGGDLVAIDVSHFSDNDQPTWENLSMTGPAQQSLAVNPIYTGSSATQLSPGGQFGAVWPLFDGTNRMLVSWSQCRALDPADQTRIIPCLNAPANALPAPVLYGMWIYDPKSATQKPIVQPQEGIIFTDIVAASPTKKINQLLDPIAGSGASDLLDYGNNILSNLDQSGNELAVLDIRSVYNLDGHASASIVNQSDPSNTAYQQYGARFLQIVQGVALPANNEEINGVDFNAPNFAFGRSNVMRQIIGYVPIEPDGSVVVQVPADVPITFNILDANAQRITNSEHRVWWQFRSGEVVRCTGCHDATTDANAKLTHGRLDSAVPDINPGSDGSFNYPIGNPLLLSMHGNRAGQTLAEIYAANKQFPRQPSLNVFFSDEWAVNPGQRKPTIDARYVNDDPAHPRQVPVSPVTADACLLHWNARCRIIINYDEHIQPIWEKSRPVVDNSNTVIGDNRCTSCHAVADTLGAAQVPAGQLELTGGPSTNNAKIKTSFQELFNGDTQRDIAGAPIPELDNGVPVLDADGNPVFMTIGATMRGGSARGSNRFFGCFNGGTCGNLGGTPTTNHSGMLTPAELRLLSEWLDNGAQYYNDVVKAVQAGQ